MRSTWLCHTGVYFYSRLSYTISNDSKFISMTPNLSNITNSPNLPSYIKYLALMIKDRPMFPIGEYFEFLGSEMFDQVWDDLISSDKSEESLENHILFVILLATAEGINIDEDDEKQFSDILNMAELVIKAVYASRAGQLEINFKHLTLEPTGLRPILL